MAPNAIKGHVEPENGLPMDCAPDLCGASRAFPSISGRLRRDWLGEDLDPELVEAVFGDSAAVSARHSNARQTLTFSVLT